MNNNNNNHSSSSSSSAFDIKSQIMQSSHVTTNVRIHLLWQPLNATSSMNLVAWSTCETQTEKEEDEKKPETKSAWKVSKANR